MAEGQGLMSEGVQLLERCVLHREVWVDVLIWEGLVLFVFCWPMDLCLCVHPYTSLIPFLKTAGSVYSLSRDRDLEFSLSHHKDISVSRSTLIYMSVTGRSPSLVWKQLFWTPNVIVWSWSWNKKGTWKYSLFNHWSIHPSCEQQLYSK